MGDSGAHLGIHVVIVVNVVIVGDLFACLLSNCVSGDDEDRQIGSDS